MHTALNQDDRALCFVALIHCFGKWSRLKCIFCVLYYWFILVLYIFCKERNRRQDFKLINIHWEKINEKKLCNIFVVAVFHIWFLLFYVTTNPSLNPHCCHPICLISFLQWVSTLANFQHQNNLSSGFSRSYVDQSGGREREKKFLTKSDLIQIAFAPKEETSKPFRKNKLTVISFV